MSLLQHFVTLNSSQSSSKEGLTREMFINTRREISCLCVDLLQVDLLASGASLVNPTKDFFESLVSARPRNMLYLFLAEKLKTKSEVISRIVRSHFVK